MVCIRQWYGTKDLAIINIFGFTVGDIRVHPAMMCRLVFVYDFRPRQYIFSVHICTMA